METDSGMETHPSMKSAWCNSFSQAGQQMIIPGCDAHNVQIVLCVSFPPTAACPIRIINQDSGLSAIKYFRKLLYVT